MYTMFTRLMILPGQPPRLCNRQRWLVLLVSGESPQPCQSGWPVEHSNIVYHCTNGFKPIIITVNKSTLRNKMQITFLLITFGRNLNKYSELSSGSMYARTITPSTLISLTIGHLMNYQPVQTTNQGQSLVNREVASAIIYTECDCVCVWPNYH